MFIPASRRIIKPAPAAYIKTLSPLCGATEVSRTLSASQADFKPGQTYSREVDFDNSTKLDNIRYDYTASNGEVLAGKLLNYYTLYIADGATVTFRGINAIVSLQGNGTIILEAGTTNSVKGISNSPGIYVPSGKTLTIRGSGSLEASAYDYAAGIGAGKNASCGNIAIEGNVSGTNEVLGGNLSLLNGYVANLVNNLTSGDGTTGVSTTSGSGFNDDVATGESLLELQLNGEHALVVTKPLNSTIAHGIVIVGIHTGSKPVTSSSASTDITCNVIICVQRNDSHYIFNILVHVRNGHVRTSC